jgi:exopolysaccharide biosynthesis polyprenyl glycosylphosphotransferase
MPTSAAPSAIPIQLEEEPPPDRARRNPRLLAQLAGAATARRHFFRALRRITVLGAFDLTVLLTARTALRFLRDLPATSESFTALVPRGSLGGGGAVAAIIVGLVFTGAYASEERWTAVGTVFKGVALGTALALWQSIDTHGMVWTAPRWLLLTGALGLTLAVARTLLGDFVFRYRLGAKPSDRVTLVGDPQSQAGRRAAEAVLQRPGMQSVGWLSERADVEHYLGHPSAVWEVLRATETDTVLLCGDLPPQLFDAVVEAAAVSGCRVLSIHHHDTLMASQPRALNGGDLRMLELTFPAARAGQDVVKRAFDAVMAALLLALLSPLLLLIALLVTLDSPGPVLFVQERVGQAGRVFRMLKFRTMRTGADDEKDGLAHLNHTGDSRLFKIPNDPRVTTVGARLRAWSLDEIPQLLNVISGDMSLVGPRPFFERDLGAYDDHQFLRLAVKPGITGLWQVQGRSSIVDFEEVVRLDRRYIENWSLALDLRILLATIPAVLRRTGAY